MLEQTQIVLQGLREAKTRIQNDPLRPNTHCSALSHTLSQELTYLLGYIPILRIILHIARLTEHMHEADR
ncbi:hypothetical protein PCL1391_0673 [Pseudomonas chlororaphis subsp. piscium]|nr:hypothetical protein PCL1391_0673 [Pseudomonas chlororaphis subsp. piscium]